MCARCRNFFNVLHDRDSKLRHRSSRRPPALAGIYVLINFTEPGYNIDRGTPEWNAGLYNGYTAVIDAMHKYNKNFEFLVDDDIAISPTTICAFIRAAVRDLEIDIDKK